MRLPRSFFAVDSRTLARRLLGQRLVRVLDGERLSGIIVEAEAYVGVRDRASHAFGGRRTPRNESMYSRPGTAYVYFTYGAHFCMNVVCGRDGVPLAVLLRAIEPEEGLDRMRALRLEAPKPPRRLEDDALCRGPGNLCRALGIDRALDGVDLVDGESVWIERARRRAWPQGAIAWTPRVGLGSCGEWTAKPLRAVVRSSRCVTRGFGSVGWRSAILGKKSARSADPPRPTGRAKMG